MTAAVTIRHSPKPFAWSYSRLKNYETCPRRHEQVDIKKNYNEESEQLEWGERVHKAAAARLAKGTPLPVEMEAILEAWCQKILKREGALLVEQKLAITKDFKPCGYFDKGVWFRSVADVVQVFEEVALVTDWKTGKILEDSLQLAFCAQCVFSHHPKVQLIQSEYIWLKEDATTEQQFKRRDMPAIWKQMEERIARMQQSYETGDFPPTHNKLCRKWCPVTTCEFHGVSTWE